MPESNPIGEAIAKAARDDLESRGRGRIEVPEWSVDGVPAVIYFKPFTMADQFDITSYRKDDGPHYGMVRAIILKAEDAYGQRLFTLEQERVFLQASASVVVARVANAIMAGPKVEDAVKN